jgi:ABC-type sugar transport system substrate-binding protein
MAYVVSTEDEYLGLLRDEVVAAAEEKGVNMEVLYSGNDALKMIDCVEAAKSKGKDAVLINLHAAEEAKACIEAAGDDMKVVFVNREPDDPSLLNENVVVVGSDEHQSGKFQGEYLADYFKGIGQTDVNYVLLRGTDGLVHTTLRSEGVVAAMKENGLNVHEVASVEAEYDRNTAKSEMDTVLPGLKYDCIIANNDAMAIGAIMAMEDAGTDPASVPVVGIDATEDAKELIRQGKMAMSVFQSAKGQAEGSVAAAINMIEGNDLAKDTNCEVSKDNPHVLYVPFVPVTAENVDDI